jgi:hypothetical protein
VVEVRDIEKLQSLSDADFLRLVDPPRQTQQNQFTIAYNAMPE